MNSSLVNIPSWLLSNLRNRSLTLNFCWSTQLLNRFLRASKLKDLKYHNQIILMTVVISCASIQLLSQVHTCIYFNLFELFCDLAKAMSLSRVRASSNWRCRSDDFNHSFCHLQVHMTKRYICSSSARQWINFIGCIRISKEIMGNTADNLHFGYLSGIFP